MDTSNSPKSRFAIARSQTDSGRKHRPFIILGLLLFLVALGFIAYAFVNAYIVPANLTAIRVGDVVYTRGDVIEFIRFEQRISEEAGIEFSVGSSFFEATDNLIQYELAHQSAARFNITVSDQELEQEVQAILGFVPSHPEEEADPSYQASYREARRLFLNKAEFSEETWLEFVRKSLFRRNLRDVLANDVPRIQPHAELHVISFMSAPSPEELRELERDLQSGLTLEALATKFSEDPDILRHSGRFGWTPAGVLENLDGLIFGVRENGLPVLPIGVPSPPIFETKSGFHNVYIINSIDTVRSLTDTHFKILADRTLTSFMNAERQRRAAVGEFSVILNSEIYEWAVRQVQNSAIVPTPTPASPFSGLTTGS